MSHQANRLPNIPADVSYECLSEPLGSFMSRDGRAAYDACAGVAPPLPSPMLEKIRELVGQ